MDGVRGGQPTAASVGGSPGERWCASGVASSFLVEKRRLELRSVPEVGEPLPPATPAPSTSTAGGGSWMEESELREVERPVVKARVRIDLRCGGVDCCKRGRRGEGDRRQLGHGGMQTTHISAVALRWPASG